MDGRDREAHEAAVEALERYLIGGPRRLANRVDPQADVLTAAAACCAVLGGVAADAGRHEQAARLLGRADDLHGQAAAPVPPCLRDDLDRVRAAASAQLGDDAFVAAVERGRHVPLDRLLAPTV
jgi:hypothetical protein